MRCERSDPRKNERRAGGVGRVPHSLRILQRVRFLNFPSTPFIPLNL